MWVGLQSLLIFWSRTTKCHFNIAILPPQQAAMPLRKMVWYTYKSIWCPKLARTAEENNKMVAHIRIQKRREVKKMQINKSNTVNLKYTCLTRSLGQHPVSQPRIPWGATMTARHKIRQFKHSFDNHGCKATTR